MVTGRIVVINGASSAGKTSIVRALRELEAVDRRYWHVVGLDDVLARLAWQWVDVGWPTGPGPMCDQGLSVAQVDGVPTLRVGPLLRKLLRGHQEGAAAIADQGVDLLIDEVIMDSEQLDDWRRALDPRSSLWVGVHCDVAELDRRESLRHDRPAGLARAQAEVVHRDIAYDLELDSTTTTAAANAAALARFLRR
jgi:chloramphenicol 3-O phosphotransferase